MKRLFILFICAGVFAFGCTQGKSSSNPVIAKGKGIKITKNDFLNEFNRLPEWAKEGLQGKEGKERFLDEIIKRELLYQEAKKQGLEKDKDVKARIEEFKKMSLITALFKKEIEEKARIVEDKEVKEFYDKNLQEFISGEEVKVSHILVNTEEEAKKLLVRIKKGEDFSKLAKSFSKDPGSAGKGGELGFIKRRQMVPEFEQVAFSLKKGEISNLVKTQFGYHIIKVTARKEGEKSDYANVKDTIKDTIKGRLMREKQKNLFDSLIEKLKEKGKIEINEKNLETVSF